jgi:hypothetical protein
MLKRRLVMLRVTGIKIKVKKVSQGPKEAMAKLTSRRATGRKVEIQSLQDEDNHTTTPFTIHPTPSICKQKQSVSYYKILEIKILEKSIPLTSFSTNSTMSLNRRKKG